MQAGEGDGPDCRRPNTNKARVFDMIDTCRKL